MQKTPWFDGWLVGEMGEVVGVKRAGFTSADELRGAWRLGFKGPFPSAALARMAPSMGKIARRKLAALIDWKAKPPAPGSA